MELILAKDNGEEVGVLPWDADFELGGENNFEIVVPQYEWSGAEQFNDRTYMPGTEYGGMIGEIRTETEPRSVLLRGITWRGMIARKIISPNKGQNYYTIQGSVAGCIAQLLQDFFQDSIIQADTEAQGNIKKYQFPRYCNLMEGLNGMLATVGQKAVLTYVQTAGGGYIKVGAGPIENYEDLSADEMEVRSDVRKNGINHLICLGQGELANRTVLHIYTDSDGKITEKQVLKGRYENAAVFDYSGVETTAELKSAGLEYLKDVRSGTTIEAEARRITKEMEIGDMVRAADPVTGVTAWRAVERKILRISGGVRSVEYKLEGEE